MRAITGVIVSSEPCPLRKAARSLTSFSKSAASHLPSSDCRTYLHTVDDATKRLIVLREELGGRRTADFDAYDYEDPVEGDRRHQDQESEGGTAVAADGSHRDSAAVAELDVASGKKGKKKKKNKKKKKKKKKKKNEDPSEDRAVVLADSHIPSSPEIDTEKRRKKKHSNKEIVVYVKQEPSVVVEEELVSEKKRKKKKKKDHVKLEEIVNAVEEKIVNDSAAEQRVARTERERKKKKHEPEEGGTVDMKEEKVITDGDPDREKKRKKKRDRGDIYENASEQVEHAKKKQKKHSGD